MQGEEAGVVIAAVSLGFW